MTFWVISAPIRSFVMQAVPIYSYSSPSMNDLSCIQYAYLLWDSEYSSNEDDEPTVQMELR